MSLATPPSKSPTHTSDEESARKAKEAITEIVTHSFEKSMAYANLIIIAGYAGGFTLWNFTRAALSPRGTATIALLFGVSLASFIAFEVYKMIYATRFALQQRVLIIQNLSPRQFLDELARLNQKGQRSLLGRLMPLWVVALSLAVASAIGASVLLFYSFFATLFCWPAWP
jgi:hypothetical protein